MLVLSRKSGERIVIGRNIVLKVVDIGTNRVRLAIAAPQEIAIYRQEVDQRIQDERGSLTGPQKPSNAERNIGHANRKSACE
jgi:carbon storage regulator